MAAHQESAPSDDLLKGTIVKAGGHNLNVVNRGKGPAVLMLHGFPNSSTLYKHQIPFLVDHGFQVIVPDLLGFGGSDKPQDVEPYTLDNQVTMLKEVLDQLGVDKAVVVGHDWGAGLAWHFAALAPERTTRLVALSVGHPAQYFNTGEQQQLSWYMLIFLHEGLAERVITDGSVLSKVTPASQMVLFATDEFVQMFADLAKPGNATAGLNWYRANVTPEKMVAGYITQTPPVEVDTLMIWPTGDHYACCEAQAKGSEAFVKGRFRYERVECDSHFVTWSAPDKVNELLLGFLTES
ncbi:hypothetical protein KFL_005420020 [Klebsormidium nitens]|uniref:AB hydrolase-1 domain-containing protein n=1 Tax=Klebsormidium nitens TaxID=105231 RepID=A0A1Y1IKD4_KLENI|nr:hypothetical protein KFL_005420020 [Klebsormidium nitens]|eukprot:GAQ89611.1 hypothetical protein KFL_005420020 [Klebsormidium nitens]